MYNIVLWEEKVFEFGLKISGAFALDLPTLRTGPYVIPLQVTCPGATYCGNPDPCKLFKNINIPIPKSPWDIKLPSFDIKVSLSYYKKFTFPPKVVLPLSCPMYPDNQPHPEQYPEVNPFPKLPGGDKYGIVIELSLP